MQASLGCEVVTLVKVSDKTRVRWLPAQQLLSACAGRRVVDRDEWSEPAEVSRRLLGRDARGPNALLAADGLGDPPDRNAIVAHLWGYILQRQFGLGRAVDAELTVSATMWLRESPCPWAAVSL